MGIESYTIMRSTGVRRVSVRDLHAGLRHLLDEVTDGDIHVLITRNGMPEAALVPVGEYHAMEEMDDMFEEAARGGPLPPWAEMNGNGEPD